MMPSGSCNAPRTLGRYEPTGKIVWSGQRVNPLESKGGQFGAVDPAR